MISFSAIYFALSDVDPITGTIFRMAYALPVLFVLWWVVRDRDNRPRSRRWLAAGAGFMLAIDVFLWHEAINHIGAGLATLIANSQVIWVAIGAWLIHKERPRRTTLFAVPVVLSGVALVSGIGQEGAFGTRPLLGAVLAFVAALFYATFLLGYRASNDSFAPQAAPLIEATLGGLFGALLIGVVLGRGLDLVPTFPAHWWLIALGVSAQAIGWLLIGYALPRLPATETATIILLQPVLTMVWGAIFFSENPSRLQLIGALVVLAGVGFVALNRASGPDAVGDSATQDDNEQHAGRALDH